MTLSEETDRACIHWQWHWMLMATVEMLGPSFVWSIGFQALGYPPTWIHTKDEADAVIKACLEKLKEKLKWD